MRNSKRSEIRFPGFTVEWNQCKLADVADRMKSYSLSRDVETADNTGYKYIHYGDIHTKIADIIDENSELPNIKVGDYELLQKNDVVVADASEDYQGIATPAVVTYTPEFNLVSGLHTIALRPKKTVAIYLYYLLNTQIFKKYGYKVGTGMKVFGISSTNLMKFEARYPSLDEQEKIGNFLKQLDDTIALYQNELDVLKKTKKGFLQKMFPKEGESVPEIRFPGFTDDWEQRKLGDYKDVRDGTHDSPKYHLRGHPLVTSKNLKDSGLDLSEVSFISDEDFEMINKRSNVDVGDILFGMIGTIGNPIIVDTNDFAIKNVALIKNGGEISNEFLIHLLKSSVFDKYIRNENVGNTQKFLSLSKIREFTFLSPSNEEQLQIGRFFKGLDNTIALHQRELESLKKTKKAFLQKMFINS